MSAFIALLRAVNVGGSGKLPMRDLTALCQDAGFTKVRTYIASGNVLFESDLNEAKVKAVLEKRLHAYAAKPVGVLVRTAAEMAAVVEANPFPKAPPNRTVAIFLDHVLAQDALHGMAGRKDEQIELGKREIYIHYTDGIASSKLRIPVTKAGTARNLNTVAKLAQIAANL